MTMNISLCEIKWSSLIYLIFFHVFGLYWCVYYAFPVKLQSVLFAIFMYLFSGEGITMGVHRYWTHRSFKAKRPLQILLMICFSSCGQNSIHDWVRDHRVHHKCSETEADPHNANRGFFFSHIGWLMLKKNDQVLTEGKKIDMRDITGDPMLVMQHKYFIWYNLVFCFILPTITGIFLWDENWRCAIAWQCFIRYLAVFHSEMTVNSLAHIYGYRPFNKNIEPRENWFVSICTVGEGWHNYHHMFPYDYRASEFCDKLNVTAILIDLFARCGWAYDLKMASLEAVKSTALKLGDGSVYKEYSYISEKTD